MLGILEYEPQRWDTELNPWGFRSQKRAWKGTEAAKALTPLRLSAMGCVPLADFSDKSGTFTPSTVSAYVKAQEDNVAQRQGPLFHSRARAKQKGP